MVGGLSGFFYFVFFLLAQATWCSSPCCFSGFLRSELRLILTLQEPTWELIAKYTCSMMLQTFRRENIFWFCKSTVGQNGVNWQKLKYLDICTWCIYVSKNKKVEKNVLWNMLVLDIPRLETFNEHTAMSFNVYFCTEVKVLENYYKHLILRI